MMNKLIIAIGIVGSGLIAMSSTCSTGDVSGNSKKASLPKVKLQSDGIKFSNLSLEKAMEESTKTGKLIFIDAYTDWCGPCKIMAANAFKDAEVGAFFNENFINLKIEMEKDPDGREVAMRYKVKAYPTLLIIDDQGNLVKQTLGLQSKDQLLKFGQSAQ